MPEEGSHDGRTVLHKFFGAVYSALDGPTDWVREKIVKPNQKSYPWYHQKFRRVPTIDECYADDVVCLYEADDQYKRDRKVDTNIITILRTRFEDCTLYEAPDHLQKCRYLWDQYEEAAANWFTKYGDLGGFHSARQAYMKQKHRMIWERRHGPVGTGMQGKSVPLE